MHVTAIILGDSFLEKVTGSRGTYNLNLSPLSFDRGKNKESKTHITLTHTDIQKLKIDLAEALITISFGLKYKGFAGGSEWKMEISQNNIEFFRAPDQHSVHATWNLLPWGQRSDLQRNERYQLVIDTISDWMAMIEDLV